MKKQKSFGLLEVLIVTTIFILFAGALISLVTVGSKNAVINKHRLQAADLGREGIELTKYNRNVVWGGGSAATIPPSVTLDSVAYNRTILSVRQPSPNGYITAVTATVSWSDFGKTRDVKMITYLTDWKDATAGGGGGGPGGPTVVTEQVGVSSDDIEYRWNISEYYFSLTQTWTGAGFWNSDQKKFSGAFRFQTVAVPQGATITSAYLKITAGETNAVTTVNSKIRAEDVDDATTFSTKADFESRFPSQVTTATVNWEIISTWVYNTEYTSPDIKTVIQEVVDRSNWASNNNMVVFWDDYDNRSFQVANAARRGYSYDGNSAKAAKLSISYTMP